MNKSQRKPEDVLLKLEEPPQTEAPICEQWPSMSP